MAKHAHISLVDDIDGTKATETVHFMLDGVEYHIDLNDEHAEDLREELHRYIEGARRIGGRAIRRHVADAGTRVTNLAPGGESARIREWAAGVGIQVHPQGRIAQDVIDRYRAAQAAPTKPTRARRGRVSSGK